MLIDFTVENFRSFADAQTLSLIASTDSSSGSNVVDGGDFRLLKACAIYGANASGKSNLIKSLRFMKWLVVHSATKLNLGDPIKDVQPFRLDRQWRAKPSELEIRLLLHGTEYRYGFSVTSERVHSEWLERKRPGGRFTQELLREYDPDSGKTQWNLRGALKTQAKAAVAATRDNGLFLSRAAQMNVKLVEELYLWFRNGFLEADLSDWFEMSPHETAERISEDEGFRLRVERLIRDADIGIAQLATKEEPTIDLDTLPGDVREELSRLKVKLVTYKLRVFHRDRNSGEPIEFSLEKDESQGTQQFLAAIGPTLTALDTGSLLVVDEFDCSMHPLLTWKLVELFQSKEANSKGAQLVFATHDTNLMDPSLLRRDQIWLTERNAAGATQLFSLFDFRDQRSPRKDEAFEKNYLAGRYGGVPNFGPALEDHAIQ